MFRFSAAPRQSSGILDGGLFGSETVLTKQCFCRAAACAARQGRTGGGWGDPATQRHSDTAGSRRPRAVTPPELVVLSPGACAACAAAASAPKVQVKWHRQPRPRVVGEYRSARAAGSGGAAARGAAMSAQLRAATPPRTPDRADNHRRMAALASSVSALTALQDLPAFKPVLGGISNYQAGCCGRFRVNINTGRFSERRENINRCLVGVALAASFPKRVYLSYGFFHYDWQ